MKIETQPRDDHQVTLIVELEPEQMEGAKHRAARKISERKSIPGFRPGKAPYEVVVRSFGERVITEEAVDLLLDEVYPKALEEAKLEPAQPVHWKKWKIWIKNRNLPLPFRLPRVWIWEIIVPSVCLMIGKNQVKTRLKHP